MNYKCSLIFQKTWPYFIILLRAEHLIIHLSILFVEHLLHNYYVLGTVLFNDANAISNK